MYEIHLLFFTAGLFKKLMLVPSPIHINIYFLFFQTLRSSTVIIPLFMMKVMMPFSNLIIQPIM